MNEEDVRRNRVLVQLPLAPVHPLVQSQDPGPPGEPLVAIGPDEWTVMAGFVN
jgi:hypothetical protein